MEKNEVKFSILNEIFQTYIVDEESQTILVAKFILIDTLWKNINSSDKDFVGTLISLKDNGLITLDWGKNIVSITDMGIATLY